MSRNRSQAGKLSKTKGNSFERRIAKCLSEIWADGEFTRTPSSGGSSLKVGWKLAGDIVTTSPTFPYLVECKKREGWKLENLLSDKCVIYDWWEQTKREASLVDKLPMLIFSKNRCPIFIAIKGRPMLISNSFFVVANEMVIFEIGGLEHLNDQKERT